jgi:hypothetical protein
MSRRLQSAHRSERGTARHSTGDSAGPSGHPSTHLVVQTPHVLFSFTPDWGGAVPAPFLATARAVLLRRWRHAPRVCVLGYGLGGLAQLLCGLRPDATVVGIDPDPWMIDGARPWLPRGVRLVTSEAAPFLERHQQRHQQQHRQQHQRLRPRGAKQRGQERPWRFDVVLDDCFELTHGTPRRPRSCMALASLVAGSLTPSGIYARNVIPQRDATYEDLIADIRDCFPHVHTRRFNAWENRVAVASRRTILPASLKLLAARIR